MTVFVDTSAFYEVLNRADDRHAEAVERWQALLSGADVTLCTSNYVVVETCALLAARAGMAAVRLFVGDVLPAVRMLWVDEGIHATALARHLQSGAGGPSLVDCASLALMASYRAADIFAFDRHLEQK